MRKQLYIKDWMNIRNNRIFQKDKLVFEASLENNLNKFLKSVYETLHMDYPKFHKMDDFCKLGIVATEILFKNKEISTDTALVFSNSASSLQTDKKYQETLHDFPSPSVFVYTLPNIVLGEISIKYKLQSENAFFIAEKFNAELFKSYSESLLAEEEIPEVLCGWIDLHNEEYDVFLCRISKEGAMKFSEENLRELYYLEND